MVLLETPRHRQSALMAKAQLCCFFWRRP